MSKIFHKLFPIFDYLYIFQLMEYESIRFLKWFAHNPFSRNLQKKGSLILTLKAKLILFVSLLLISIVSLGVSQIVAQKFDPILFVITFILLQIISPLFLIISWWVVYPLQSYTEMSLVKKAKIRIKNYPNLKVVAIAGSYGKTSTKNILYTLLWKKYYTVKTPKSYNTIVSIARTILSDLKRNTQVFIVEMDSYKAGDLNRLSKLSNPDFGILTSIAPQHLERFGNMEDLANAQIEWIPQVKEKVFANFDDSLVKSKLSGNDRVLSYGLEKDLDFFATEIKEVNGGLEFYFNTKQKRTKINLPLKGKHNVINFLAAACVASKLGLSFEEIRERAMLILPTQHRLEIKEGDISFIDNSYNTNPTVAKQSLRLLKETGENVKILITPGFVELGDQNRLQTVEFMKNAARVADFIIIVGNEFKKDLSSGLEATHYPKDQTFFEKNTKEAISRAYSIAKAGDTILLENDLPDQYS